MSKDRKTILLCRVSEMARVPINPAASEAEAIRLALDMKNSPSLTWEKQTDMVLAVPEESK